MVTSSEFAIIGAGICGLTTAIALQKLDRSFQLFEKTKIIKGIGAGFGLGSNAMQALSYLDLADEIKDIAFLINSYTILDQKGQTLVDPNTESLVKQYQHENYIVHRADLHQHLLSKLDLKNLELDAQATSFEQEKDSVLIYFQNGRVHRTKYLLIADGVRSKLREQLFPKSKPRFAGYTCWRATIDNSNIQLNRGTETWGNRGRFGMSPLINNRIYWYACINAEINSSKFRNYKIKDLKKEFSQYHSPILEILGQTKEEDLIWNDIVDIKPIKHFTKGNILLMGDAAHATTPNMGQGACQALEDVAILVDELKNNKNVPMAFIQFEKRRKSRTKYITQTSKIIGHVGQWDNKTLIFLRNNIIKMIPPTIHQLPLNKLFKEDFMNLNTKKS